MSSEFSVTTADEVSSVSLLSLWSSLILFLSFTCVIMATLERGAAGWVHLPSGQIPVPIQ